MKPVLLPGIKLFVERGSLRLKHFDVISKLHFPHNFFKATDDSVLEIYLPSFYRMRAESALQQG